MPPLGSPAGYEFLTAWLLDADREDVWEALWEVERWRQWWPRLEETVEMDPGTPCGLGRRGRFTWRARVPPYPVSFELLATAVEPPRLLAAEVSGDLAGTGRWRLLDDAGLTVVLCEWQVGLAKPWMSRLDHVAGPLFRWNHDHLMAAGARGLAAYLGVRLVAAT